MTNSFVRRLRRTALPAAMWLLVVLPFLYVLAHADDGAGAGTGPLALRIEVDDGERHYGAPQGRVAYVDVDLVGVSPEFTGFRVLLGFDGSILQGVDVHGGNWTRLQGRGGSVSLDYEFFAHPDHPELTLVQVESHAEQTKGIDPSADVRPRPCDTVQTLCRVGLWITPDRTISRTFIPVRFAWLGCNDNTLIRDGREIPSTVDSVCRFYNYQPGMRFPEGVIYQRFEAGAFPMGFEPPNCRRRAVNARREPPISLAFLNGGTDICCRELHDPGDINLNGLGLQCEDLGIFTTCLLSDNPLVSMAVVMDRGRESERTQAAMQASDFDDNAVPLTLWDYYLMVRAMQGSHTNHASNRQEELGDRVRYSMRTDTLMVEAPDSLGAAVLTFDGEVVPELLALSCEMRYKYDGRVTRVLVRPLLSHCAQHIPPGPLVRVDQGRFIAGEAVLRGLPRSAGD